ncbi:MAG: sulfatase-like hydrolase/transferase [Lewinellaceae bacterium]|nr:sulfatase-like hydrolase/transferase [Lewinellaceae bacterium]
MKTILIILLPFFALAQNRPNIIFIMADDLGNGEISFNHTFASTPNIDSLAVNGAYFSQAYSQPMCTPSRAALMTGVYPWKQSWGRAVVFPWRDNYMEFGRPLLQERMRSEGYTTAMFGKWHLGHIYPEYTPINRGWDYYFGNLGGGTEYDEPYSYNVNDFNNDLQENGQNFDTAGYYTRVLGAKGCAVHRAAKPLPRPMPLLYVRGFHRSPRTRASAGSHDSSCARRIHHRAKDEVGDDQGDG